MTICISKFGIRQCAVVKTELCIGQVLVCGTAAIISSRYFVLERDHNKDTFP